MSNAQPPGIPINGPGQTVIPEMILGRFRVEAILGRGGFGEVVRAHDTLLDRTVAIKTLHRTLATDPDKFAQFQERFRREALASNRMGSHPNIVTVHDFVMAEDSTRYLIMEYIHGGTLKDRLGSDPNAPHVILPTLEALRIAAEVARGLAAAHDKQVVHRDVKPANIFLPEVGAAKVGDFGSAQVNDMSVAAQNPHTPLYASPEQIRGGKSLPPETDQYSLGLVLFEMLTGRVYKTIPVGEQDAWFVTLSERVRAVVARLLATNPADRYPSMKEVVAALEAPLAEGAVAPLSLSHPQLGRVPSHQSQEVTQPDLPPIGPPSAPISLRMLEVARPFWAKADWILWVASSVSAAGLACYGLYSHFSHS